MSQIIGFLKERINGAGKSKVSRAEVLSSCPMRNPQVAWEREAIVAEAEPVALLKIPRRRDKFGNVVAKVFRLPDFRKLELDAIGSDVWERCDGATSVDTITKAVCDRYKLNRRQAETSVTAYLKMLAERRLIILKKGTGRAKPAAKGQKKR